MDIKLKLVPYGYELQLPEGFICRDFGNSYEDETWLEIAAQAALLNIVGEHFEKELDRIYKKLDKNE